ncbi:ABC transporter permease [Nakamurella lactea]|uniref:ABC transporter permease n=1 Tax=Nakamurella lactea TaxID=459515 RepID=UPI00041DCCBD|nr:ABC transporter permease [Nakamurella lactea]
MAALRNDDAALTAGTDPVPAVRRRRRIGWGYFGRRALMSLESFLVTLVIGFIVFSLVPSDPAQSLARAQSVTPEQMADLRAQLGLDQSIVVRFFHFLRNVLTGNFGYSWEYRQSVGSLIGSAIGPTLLLMGTATLISVALGLWLGVRAGWKPGSKFDRFWTGTAVTLWSVPTFWLGMMLLVVFSIGVGPIPSLFPAGGMSDPTVDGHGIAHILDVAHHLVLPCLTLVAVTFAQNLMIMRSSLVDELGNAYLTTARAKGLRDAEVRQRHAVPNAMLPAITVIFLQVGGLVGGAIVTETVFSWPGLGLLVYNGIKIPDLPLLEGTFVIFSGSVIVFNLIADLLYRVLDPRVQG